MSTLEPADIRGKAAELRVPSLTVLAHPVLSRVGEQARLLPLLEGRAVSLSRNEPRFALPNELTGQPLGDPYVSRTPLVFEVQGDSLRLTAPSSVRVQVDGAPLEGSRTLPLALLEEGVVIELSERVALLVHLLGAPLASPPPLGMCGASEALDAVRREVLRVADLPAPVLIRGESGTGKELVALALHAQGRRARQRFLGVNVAAIPSSTAASALFGHTAGAFTGAAGAHDGYFFQADGGTLFLDEIGTMPLDLQAAVLRVLETGEVQPLGSSRVRRVDVRVLSATDSELEGAAARGEFRDALFHRLAGFQLRVPPLRRRRDDIARLIVHFVREELSTCGEAYRLAPETHTRVPWLTASVVARLVRGRWPGNVRQLRNVVRQLVSANRGREQAELTPELEALCTDLPVAPVQHAPVEPAPVAAPMDRELSEARLLEALREHGWRPTPAARALGISRTTLYAWIERSDRIRKARDVPMTELELCLRECDGDVDEAAARLQVSARGLRLRLREEGLS
ncbi:MAG: sigma 54-interacting transcriptional regulator [Myxococcaceae bacterium]|nr:sigma 54-interacting transcriptional regulator [Myxococcaceae bacterium]MCI0671245.1 sigma 54-interacting transcriptional regulator [Myxococcaceae bacterium]